MKTGFFRLLSLLLLLSTSSPLLAANMHYEIDVMTRLSGNNQGLLGSLKMSWLYDEETTRLLLKGKNLSAEKRQASLDKLGKRIIRDLGRVNYFTRIQLNGQPAKTTKAANYSVELVQEKYLRLLFELPLARAIDPKNNRLEISLSDPNGAALLYYSDAHRLSTEDTLKARCEFYLHELEEFEHGEAAQRIDARCF